ncbi:MAG: fatty acid hydroxylase, partial [Myxococcota bacterium]
MHYGTIVSLIFLGFAIVELRAGKFWQKRGRLRDGIIDVACALVLPMVVIPMILTVSPAIVDAVLPGAEGALADWPWWAMFGVLLL